MNSDCPHRVLRKMKTDGLEYTGYICGSCSTVFEVAEHEDPPPYKPEPMDRNPIPWGLRDRQA